MTKKQRAVLAVEALKQEYPDAICSLTYREPLQLLIATRLSAQCTDARVNMVTPALFERFPTFNDFAEASYISKAAACSKQNQRILSRCAKSCATTLAARCPTPSKR